MKAVTAEADVEEDVDDNSEGQIQDVLPTKPKTGKAALPKRDRVTPFFCYVLLIFVIIQTTTKQEIN